MWRILKSNIRHSLYTQEAFMLLDKRYMNRELIIWKVNKKINFYKSKNCCKWIQTVSRGNEKQRFGTREGLLIYFFKA